MRTRFRNPIRNRSLGAPDHCCAKGCATPEALRYASHGRGKDRVVTEVAPEDVRLRPTVPVSEAVNALEPSPGGGGFGDFIERFLALEEKVEELEFLGQQERENASSPQALLARVDDLARRIPIEDKVKGWAKDAVDADFTSLRVRMEDLEVQVENRSNLGELADSLESRVAALEQTTGGGKPLQNKVAMLERYLVGEIERMNKMSPQFTELANAVSALADATKK